MSYNHIGFTEKEIKQYSEKIPCILMGDPDRTDTVAKECFKYKKELSRKRGLVSYVCYNEKTKPVLLATSGMGGPSTSIVVNELAQVGVDTIVRLGTCGSIQDHINPGSLIISQAALCFQGAAHDIAPPEYPATADPFLTVALHKALKDHFKSVYVGITASVDTFYEGQERYSGFNHHLMRKHTGKIEEYKYLNVLNFEMESGTLFKSALVYKLKAACVCIVVAARQNNEKIVFQTTPHDYKIIIKAILKSLYT